MIKNSVEIAQILNSFLVAKWISRIQSYNGKSDLSVWVTNKVYYYKRKGDVENYLAIVVARALLALDKEETK